MIYRIIGLCIVMLFVSGATYLGGNVTKTSSRIFDVTEFGAGNGIDDTAAIAAAATACGNGGGGYIWFPPIGHSFIIKTANSIVTPAGCVWKGIGHLVWPGPFDNTEKDWTNSGAWIRCDDKNNPCINLAATGSGVENINFWQTQPTPPSGTQCSSPCTFTHNWTPTTYPYVIEVSPGANFTRLSDLNFVNATNCIDIEGPASGVQGIYTSIEHSSFGCANVGIRCHLVDNTLYLADLRHEMWWYQGSSDWWGYLEGSGNHKDWDLEYCANPQFNGIEFAFSGLAIYAADATVSSTFASEHFLGSNVSFNEVCQAIAVQNSTTHLQGYLSNVTLFDDTNTSATSGQCANQSGATTAANFALQLNSDNAQIWIEGLDGGFVQGLALIGGGAAGSAHGQLHITNLTIQNYSAFQNSTPLLKTDTTGSAADVTGLDFVHSTTTPGAKCSGLCVSHVPYNDVAANLPTCSSASVGASLYITDITAALAFGNTVTTGSGGGSNERQVTCNGSNWVE